MLLILYLTVQTFQSVFLFIYLFQLKEYRLDRLKAHFKTISGNDQLINNFNLLKWKKFIFPRLTFRSGLVFLISLYFLYNFFFIFLSVIYLLLNGLLLKVFLAVILSLALLIFLIPIMAIAAGLISNFLLFPVYKLIFHLASLKMKEFKNLQTIGITGSYGKTASKEIISFLLASKFKVLKTPLNCNTKLGIAFVILKDLKPEHEVFVCEIGAYKIGEIREICQMIRPKIGIITGINEQHLELFGSLKDTIKAKYEMIAVLPKNGLAVFNAKNKLVLKLSYRKKKNKKLYGRKRIFYKSGLTGDWYQEAIQAGFVIGNHFGLSERKMKQRLKEFKNFPLALKIKKIKKAKVIDDSYSSNPNGFLAVLDLIAKMPAKKKILITPGIIELGQASDKIHQTIGKKAAKVCQQIILTKKDFYQPILKGVKKIMVNLPVEIEENSDKLVAKLKPYLKKDSLILIEGRVDEKIKIGLMGQMK